MLKLLRSVALVALTCTAVTPRPAIAGGAGDCRHKAIETLRALAPDGFAVYLATRDKSFFLNWIDCDDRQFGLPTAVHESVHFITAETDAFPLVDGGEIKRAHEVSAFFAPARIARSFTPSDFVTTYLRPGQASSATDFLYLLDELNAYTHELNAAIDLQTLRSADEEVDSRDGLAAAMAFVAVYVQRAQDTEPVTWRGLQEPQVAATMAQLWSRAEGVMASSCGIPNIGAEDKTFIRQFCEAKAQASLKAILGRAPLCPTACLTRPDTAWASEHADAD